MTLTNNKFAPKNMLARSARTGPPAPAHKLALAGTPAQPHFAPLQEKTIRHIGLEDPGRKVRFVGFIRFVGFNFGQIKKIRFVFNIVWSYSFGHLDWVK